MSAFRFLPSHGKTPTMAVFRPHGLRQSAVLRFGTNHFRNKLIHYSSGRVAARTPNAHDLPLSSGAQSVWPRPPTTHLQLVKTQYGIVRQQNWFSPLWYPNRVYGEDFFTSSVPLYVDAKTQDILLSTLLYKHI